LLYFKIKKLLKIIFKTEKSLIKNNIFFLFKTDTPTKKRYYTLLYLYIQIYVRNKYGSYHKNNFS